ncbi:MAG: hypothetical protein LQ345_006763 [Seirophora villosa]|nr:MAG: hypothetical protein LQ345_006763 [Seirophora villosa]
MEANPSTPVRRSGLGFGYTSFDSPASGVSSNGFARPQSYCEGVSTISCRSQSASPSKSSASSAKTYKLKKSRSQSPVKSIKTQLTNTQLTMASLRICCPSITQRSLDDACRVDGASMPPAVHVFMNKLPRGTQGFIPVSLRSVYNEISNSPTKQREAPDESEYTAVAWPGLDGEKIRHLRTVVDEVIKSADFNAKTGAHECHWGASTVAPLLAEISRLPSLANVQWYNM